MSLGVLTTHLFDKSTVYFYKEYFLISASLIWTIIASALVPVLTEDTKTYRFPYSLFLSGIGSIFTVVLAFIYLVRLIKVMSALSPSYQPLK